MTPDKKLPGTNQLRIIWFAATTFAVAVVFAIIAAIIWGLGKIVSLLSPVLWPLAIALVVAYLMDPPVSWLERRGVARKWAITIVFAAVFCFVAGLTASIVPQMIKETNKLVSKIPASTARAQVKFTEWANRAEKAATEPSSQETNAPAGAAPAPSHSASSPASKTNTLEGAGAGTNQVPAEVSSNIHKLHRQILASASDWTEKALTRLGSWLLAQLAKATALVDVAIALILIPIYAFYFLREKRWIRAHWTNYLPIRHPRVKEEIIFILEAINQYMIAFFRGQVVVSICSGVLYTIGFLIIGLDYAFLLGLFCLLFTMVPFLGAIINCIVAVSLTAMQFGDWFHPLMVFILFTVVVSLENFFYSPRIMGNRVGLHPLIIIVAVMVGITLLGGVLGGVLAIPLAAALRVILFRYVWRRTMAFGRKV